MTAERFISQFSTQVFETKTGVITQNNIKFVCARNITVGLRACMWVITGSNPAKTEVASPL